MDDGETIVYTGAGGMEKGFVIICNNIHFRKQIADQTLERGNLALAESEKLKKPVRVTRGSNLKSMYAPLEVRVRRYNSPKGISL